MKKNILFLIVLFMSVYSIKAQDFDFDKIKSEIESKVLKNQWDEILLLAPDLLISNPDKGDGYYFTALAFFKLELKDKANIYVKKAELMADDELLKKINLLKNEINQISTLYENKELANKLQENNDLSKAAKYWKIAWVSDKSNLEYGLNAVDLFIKEQKYSQALEILNDDVFKNESDAFLIIERLKKTPEIIYSNAIYKGDAFFNNNNFYEAISEYKKALNSNYNNNESRQKLRLAEEEYSWKKARKENSVYSMKEYINDYPNGKYLDTAKKLLLTAFFPKQTTN